MVKKIKKINKLMDEFGVENKKILSAVKFVSWKFAIYFFSLDQLLLILKFLILDEPCSNLDDNFRIKVENYIKKYQKKK